MLFEVKNYEYGPMNILKLSPTSLPEKNWKRNRQRPVGEGFSFYIIVLFDSLEGRR